MTKEKFRTIRLNNANSEMLKTISDIVEEYGKDGYKLTLRQLYYQLVSRDIIANKTKEYVKLSILLVKGRMAGLIDWDAIEDRNRVPFIPYWVVNIEDAINDTIKQYRLDRQRGQKNYIEVWVEKDALSGILKRITSHYHIKLMSNKGYSSCTAIHDAFIRFKREERSGKKTIILYIGDYDPSGLDMIRDIDKRLTEFGVHTKVIPIGLTMKQINKYKPPPNPAKITDPRAKWYIAEHGKTSWEVDSLNPKTLHELVEHNVEKLIDMDLFKERISQEERDKEKLRKIINEDKVQDDEDDD